MCTVVGGFIAGSSWCKKNDVGARRKKERQRAVAIPRVRRCPSPHQYVARRSSVCIYVTILQITAAALTMLISAPPPLPL